MKTLYEIILYAVILVFIALVSVSTVKAFETKPEIKVEQTFYVVILGDDVSHTSLATQTFYKDKSHIIILSNLFLNGSEEAANQFFGVLIKNGAAVIVAHLNYFVEFDSKHDGYVIYKVVL